MKEFERNRPPVPSDVYTKDYYLHCRQGSDEFERSGGAELSPIHARILDLACPAPGRKILDVGCGCGELTIHSALRGAYAVGVDYSKDACELASASAKKLGVEAEFVNCDVSELPSETFDSIILADVVEHLTPDQLSKLFADLRSRLSSDGTLVIHTWPNRWHTEYSYPIARFLLSLVGIKKPKSPRKPHDEIMHVNEQSPWSLRRTLRRAGYLPKIWLEHFVPEKAGALYRFTHSAPLVKLFFADHLFALARKEIA